MIHPSKLVIEIPFAEWPSQARTREVVTQIIFIMVFETTNASYIYKLNKKIIAGFAGY